MRSTPSSLLRVFSLSSAVLATAVSTSGCGSDVDDGSVDVALSCVPNHAGEPPSSSPEASPPDGSDRVFAMSSLRLSSTDGVKTPTSHALVGLNLDGLATTLHTADCPCAPTPDARASDLADGKDGRDNAFVHHVFPSIEGLDTQVEPDTDAMVRAGQFSWLLRLHGIGDGTSYSDLSAEVFEAAPLVGPDGMPATPLGDGSDVWSIAYESVSDGDAASPLLRFEGAYSVAGDGGGLVWVGHGKGTLPLVLDLGYPARLIIHDPILVLPISANRAEVTAASLGGTLDPSELIAEVERIAGLVDKSFCAPSGAVDVFVNLITAAQDLPAPDAAKSETCARISIGLSFDAVSAKIGDVAPPTGPLANACAD